MKIKQVLFAVALAATAWMVAANSNSVQAKYESDLAAYEDVTDGDPLPTQPRMESTQPQMIAFNFEAFKSARMTGEIAAASVEETTAKSTTLDGLLNTAFKYIGVRYRSGMSGPNGFDCSGFTSFVYRQHGLQLTHSSRAQYNEGQHINDIAQLQKGDLVFFGGSRGGVASIGHVGIVTEVDPASRSFKFIHASTSSGIKVDSSQDAYYSRRYVGACRVIQ